MLIKTKKYKLNSNLYIKYCLKNIIYNQWWFFIVIIIISSFIFFLNFFLSFFFFFISIFFYFLFWFIKFYGITKFDENRVIFEKVNYQISSQKIVIQLNTKQGMPVNWDQIKYVSRGENYFLLVISSMHIIYLPYKIFNSIYEIKFMEVLLKRKNLFN